MTESNKYQPVILSAVRTPIGKFQGGLGTLTAPELGAIVIKEAVNRAKISDPTEINEVFMGNVVSAGIGQNPARQAAIKSGLPSSVGATTINKVCGSGLKTAMLASSAIKAGDGDLFIAGGMESMSQAPFLVRGRMGELRYGHKQLVDSLLHDGLWDCLVGWGMGDAAEFIAKEFNVSRDAMDELSFKSHQNAVSSIENGRFKDEIISVEVKGRKGKISIVDTDESPRKDTTLEALSKLKPAFQKDGRVTAGNAPGLNDGASAVVVSSAEKAEQIGINPLAKIVGYNQIAVEPKYIFIAPARAIPALLDQINWTMEDVDLFELNEAFAAQALADGYEMEKFGWNWSKMNVNGGAVALGHPIGASGTRVLTTLIYALKQRGLKRGIASLCLGGAEAIAMAIEIID